MLNFSRLGLVAIAFLSALSHVFFGVMSWSFYEDKFLLIASVVIYLASVLLAVGVGEGIRLPTRYGILVAVGAIATVATGTAGIETSHIGTYASWYVGGMGILLGLLAVRGQSILAYLGALNVFVIVLDSTHWTKFLSLGLEGVLILIAAGQATARAVTLAGKEVQEYAKREQDSQMAIAAAGAKANERKSRLVYVFDQALVALSYISSMKKPLAKEFKERVLLLEAKLRDEIRGRFLVNDAVRRAVTEARKRGVQVLLLDEGGLENLGDSQRDAVLANVVSAIDSVKSGKVTVRSPIGEKHLVTVVATRPGTKSPDLWLKF